MASDPEVDETNLAAELRAARAAINHLQAEKNDADLRFRHFQDEVRQWREERASAMATQPQAEAPPSRPGEEQQPQDPPARPNAMDGLGAPAAEAASTAAAGQTITGKQVRKRNRSAHDNGQPGEKNGNTVEISDEEEDELQDEEGGQLQAPRMRETIRSMHDQSAVVAQSLALSVQLQQRLLNESLRGGAGNGSKANAEVTPANFTKSVPSYKETIPQEQLRGLLNEPLKILPSHVDKLLNRGDKYDIPSLWNMKDQQTRMRSDIGSKTASVSNETIFFILRSIRAAVMLTADVELAVSQSKPAQAYQAIDELRLAMGAVLSKVTHDMFTRSWLSKDTAKQRSGGQIIEELSKMDVHLPYLVNDELIQTATLLRQSGLVTNAPARNANTGSYQNNGKYGSGNKFKKRNFGAPAAGRTSYNSESKADNNSAAGGFNPNYKGNPANYIPGFKRNAQGAGRPSNGTGTANAGASQN